MGVGKTTVGKKLATKLNYTFIDLDQLVEDENQKSITQVFSDSGESAFRLLESRSLRALKLDSPLVISTGGGTPCFHGNGAYMLEQGMCIWLKGEVGFLASRLAGKTADRPLADANLERKDLEQELGVLLESRIEYYETANIKIDALHLDWNDFLKLVETTPGG